MFQYLEKLRQKPTHIRKRIAFFVTSIFFVMIVLVWGLTFNTPDKRASQEITKEKTISPFDTLKETFGNISDDVSSKFKGIKQQVINGNEG